MPPRVIESSILPPEAVETLQSFEVNQAEQAADMARRAAMEDCHRFVWGWLEESKRWRDQSYESLWRKYQMDADAKYDTALSAKKKAWQSRAFYPLTPSHRETIKASIYKLMISQDPMFEVKPRPGGNEDMATIIRDIVLRELDKANFKNEWDKVLDDATIFGTGFALIEHEVKKDTRKHLKPKFESIFADAMAPFRRMAGEANIVGYEPLSEEVVTYNGTCFKWVSIWDIFPDPFALCVEGNPIARRFKLLYGAIERGAAEGVYFPEAVEALKDQNADQVKSSEKQAVDIDRGIADAKVERTQNAKEFECYDLYSRLPKKWVCPLMGVEHDPAQDEELVSVVLRFHEKTLIGIQDSETYDGEPPIVKMDYFKVSGRFYGRGIPEMLRDSQAVVNEVVNQRLDAGNLALNRGAVVIEKALVNPKELKEGGPGVVVKLDQKALGPNGDVRQAFSEFATGDLPGGAGFGEVGEWEVVAQQRTSANNTAMGIGSQKGDVNKTLGGQVLQRDAAADKFAYIGMLMEFDAFKRYFRRFYEDIYLNLDPQEIVWAVGPEKAQFFLANVPPPEVLARAYDIKPQGIFEMDNKAQRQAKLQAWYQQFAMFPWVKAETFFDVIGKSAGEDPTSFRLTPEELYAKMLAEGQLQISADMAGMKPPEPPRKSGGIQKAEVPS